MRIQHVNGDFWNEDNDCFGPIQSATEYGTFRDLPLLIEDDKGRLLEIDSTEYFARHNDDAVASVQS